MNMARGLVQDITNTHATGHLPHASCAKWIGKRDVHSSFMFEDGMFVTAGGRKNHMLIYGRTPKEIWSEFSDGR